MRWLQSSPVGLPESIRPGRLACGELVHARIGCVVHEVKNRIAPRVSTTGVTARITLIRG